jgi:hypothetical protein
LYFDAIGAYRTEGSVGKHPGAPSADPYISAIRFGLRPLCADNEDVLELLAKVFDSFCKNEFRDYDLMKKLNERGEGECPLAAPSVEG